MKQTFTNPKMEDAGTIAAKIFVATGVKLMADNPEDEVNGYVSTCGDVVEVVYYDKDEAPNKDHKTRFKKAGSMPSKEAIQAVL